jgi:hypothetical protein
MTNLKLTVALVALAVHHPGRAPAPVPATLHTVRLPRLLAVQEPLPDGLRQPLRRAGLPRGDPLIAGVDAPLAFGNCVVVDAGVAASHQSVFVELPVLVAVTTPPLSGAILGFIFEANRDAVLGEAPQFLAQRIVELASPFSCEEGPDCFSALEEFVSVSPLRIFGVGEGDAIGVTAVPSILGGLHLLTCGLLGEWRYRGSAIDSRHSRTRYSISDAAYLERKLLNRDRAS